MLMTPNKGETSVRCLTVLLTVIWELITHDKLFHERFQSPTTNTYLQHSFDWRSAVPGCYWVDSFNSSVDIISGIKLSIMSPTGCFRSLAVINDLKLNRILKPDAPAWTFQTFTVGLCDICKIRLQGFPCTFAIMNPSISSVSQFTPSRPLDLVLSELI